MFEFIPDTTLDFHNRGPLHPYDIEKILHEFIEDSQLASHTQLLIITGKGQVVRPTVNRLLKQHPQVKEFNHAGYFNGQDGAFEVHIF